MEELSWPEFYKAIVHPDHTSMQEYAASVKDQKLEYGNTDVIPEGTSVISIFGSDADILEGIWYRTNKGYSQGIPRKMAAVKALKRLAKELAKLSMDATEYLVTYDKQHTLTLKNKRGKEYAFNDFDATYTRPLQQWLIDTVKDKEELTNTAIEDIILEIFSELKRGKTEFTVKFFNL